MVRNLFQDHRPEYRRKRILSVFGPPPEPRQGEAKTNPNVVSSFDLVDDMVKMVGDALKDIEKHASSLTVPIGDDDNEVRAAHLRLGGDGKFITFAQFQVAINDIKKSRADYAFDSDLRGYGFGDQRKLERNRMVRALKDRKFNDSGNLAGWLEEIAGFGLGALLLWGLNELLGANHAADHAAVTSGKLPPGTEVPGVAAQLFRAMIMMIFLHGLTEEAVRGYTDLGGPVAVEGLDVEATIKQAFSSGAPDSPAFQLMRAGLQNSDNEIVAKYSVSYMATHIGDGYETWYAYLNAREQHERGLRESKTAHLYRDGALRGSDERAEGLTKLAAAGINTVSNIQSILSQPLDPQDACCLTRFLLVVDLDWLESIQTIIQMAIGILEAGALQSFNFSMDFMINPWAIIRSEVVRLADGIIDKIVDRVLEQLNIDDKVWEIIQACTPVNDLISMVLDQVEWVKQWYREMLDLFGKEVDGYLKISTEGWSTIHAIRKAKEQLRVLSRIIAEKQSLVDAELPEVEIMGIIDEVQSFRDTYDISGSVMDDVKRDMERLAFEQMPEQDRDRLITNVRVKLKASGVPETKLSRITGTLQEVAREKNDTKLNEVISYAEEGIGEDSIAGQALGGLNDLTRDALEWCRNLGDWDRLKGLFGAETNSPTEAR